jgi:hypothetical protein
MKLCTIDDCERPAVARGWCTRHYERWRRTGEPEGGAPSSTVEYVAPPRRELPPDLKLMCLAPSELARRARAAGRPDLADALVTAAQLSNGPRQPALVRAASQAIVEFLLDEVHTLS